MLKLVGAFLLALPFIGLFLLIWKQDGGQVALIIFGIVALICTLVFSGVFLLSI